MNRRDLMFKTLTGIHRTIFRASRGKVLGRGGGMPVLILTTTGRKSGKARDTVLTAPVREGDRLVIVASKGGDARHPEWFLNLRDDPNVQVTIDGETRPMTARIVDADEKAELWEQIVAKYRNYGSYQRKTERDIPVVMLEA